MDSALRKSIPAGLAFIVVVLVLWGVYVLGGSPVSGRRAASIDLIGGLLMGATLGAVVSVMRRAETPLMVSGVIAIIGLLALALEPGNPVALFRTPYAWLAVGVLAVRGASLHFRRSAEPS